MVTARSQLPFYFRFDEWASAEEKLAFALPSEEEKQACLQRVAEGQGSNIGIVIL